MCVCVCVCLCIVCCFCLSVCLCVCASFHLSICVCFLVCFVCLQSALDVPLAPSPQPGPSGLGRAVSATLSDDGQSYSVRLQANSSGTTSVTPSGTPSDEEDVAVVQVVRPASPEIITLSDSGEEEEKEESPEVTPAPASSSSSSSSSSARGKALKRRLIASNAASKHRSRKDKSLKKVHKKRPRSSRTSR